MFDNLTRVGGMAALCAVLGTSSAVAQDAPAPADTPGDTVNLEAKLLKNADDIAFSAQQLKPIALESLPAAIDLSNLPGSAVSSTAQTLRDLDRADIPGTARSLGGIARDNLPSAAGSHSTGAHSPSLPSAAQTRGRGRGRR